MDHIVTGCEAAARRRSAGRVTLGFPGIDAVRIAFIGHSYHQQTKSSEFFVTLLKELGHVELFFDESWRGQQAAWIKDFDAGAFDCVVIWQVYQAFDCIQWPHPNVVFAPMYDSMPSEFRFDWPETFNLAKIVCFSSELHREVSQHSPRARYYKYYPNPGQYPRAVDDPTFRGFFWKRVPAIDENVVARLCGQTVFDHFTIHAVPDPCSGAEMMAECPPLGRTHQRTLWHQRQEDYLQLIAQHNVFFAPRPYEGIGMGMLEAMAMGLCVVAPDTPTHNEYISDGLTGLLYDLTDVRPLSFAAVRELGARAREAVQEGFARWSFAKDDLLNFLATPTDASDRLIQPLLQPLIQR